MSSTTTSTTTTTTSSQPPSVRFSTYSGAPSLHPSIAPTMDSNTSSQGPVDSARNTIIVDDDKTPARAPSSSASLSTATDARSADLRSWAATFDRMADRRLEQQRFVPSGQKDDEISTNALGAKLERALGRRMIGQDAVFRKRGAFGEKPIEMAA